MNTRLARLQAAITAANQKAANDRAAAEAKAIAEASAARAAAELKAAEAKAAADAAAATATGQRRCGCCSSQHGQQRPGCDKGMQASRLRCVGYAGHVGGNGGPVAAQLPHLQKA